MTFKELREKLRKDSETNAETWKNYFSSEYPEKTFEEKCEDLQDAWVDFINAAYDEVKKKLGL